MKWTQEAIEKLKAVYPNLYNHEICKMFGVSKDTITKKACTLKIKKSKEFIEREKIRLAKVGEKTRIQKGNNLWTGKKRPMRGNTAKTNFKPGQLPHNTLPVGTYKIKIDSDGHSHLEVKYAEAPGSPSNRWISVSQKVWQDANGPVPKGHVVVFKKGMKTLEKDLITLDKLECISRAEHAKRNGPQTQDPEIRKLFGLKGAITRQINIIKKGNENEQSH